MNEYLKAQSKTNDAIISNAFNTDELDRFSKSDYLLKLNDIRTVSVNRILYQQSGSIPTSSGTYQKIEELALLKYFPEFVHRYSLIEQRTNAAESALKERESDCQTLIKENEELKKQIENLNKN